MFSWKRIGKNHAIEHIDPEEDSCFFLMNYEPSVSYEDSRANSLIFSLKALSRGSISEGQRHYRDKACRQFATDLEPLIGGLLKRLNGEGVAALTFIPTSKLPNDEGYDDRLEIVCHLILGKFPELSLVGPVINKAARDPASTSGGRRGPEYVARIRDNFSWQGFAVIPKLLIVVDDVVTSGGQFKALKSFVLENAPQHITVVGLLWAMTTRRP